MYPCTSRRHTNTYGGGATHDRHTVLSLYLSSLDMPLDARPSAPRLLAEQRVEYEHNRLEDALRSREGGRTSIRQAVAWQGAYMACVDGVCGWRVWLARVDGVCGWRVWMARTLLSSFLGAGIRPA